MGDGVNFLPRNSLWTYSRLKASHLQKIPVQSMLLHSINATSGGISLPNLELYVSLFDIRTGKRYYSDDHPGHQKRQARHISPEDNMDEEL